MAFAEPYERVLFANLAITAAEAIWQLTHGGEGQRAVTALLLTQDGLPLRTPVGIIASSDLSALASALGIGPSHP